MDRISAKEHFTRSSLERVLTVLRRGGMIVYPTETSYGLGCDASDAKAVEHVFRLKGRSSAKALPILVGSLPMLRRYVMLPHGVEEIIERHWPGPVTFVLRAGMRLPRVLHGGSGTVAVRISSHPIAQRIVSRFGKPLVATSANRSGKRPAYSVWAFRAQYATARNLPDLIVDGGQLPRRVPSTVASFEHGHLRILRRGRILPHDEVNDA